MRHKIKVYILIFMLLTCVCSAYLAAVSCLIKYDSIRPIGGGSTQACLFTAKILNMHFWGINNSNFPFTAHIMGTMLPGEMKPQPFTINNQQYIVFMHGHNITIYTIYGKKVFAETTGGKDINILNSCISDLNNDSADEILLLTAKTGEKYGENLVIYSFRTGQDKSGAVASLIIKEKYNASMKSLNPWKVQTADVDGDKRKEISIGVYKTAEFHPVMAKRPFIYNWEEDNISPKWLGSKLSKPFEDYIFADINGDERDELISTELLPDGSKLINSYAWKGFGFESLGESQSFQDIISLSFGSPGSEKARDFAAIVKENGVWKNAAFSYREGKLIISHIGKQEVK